MLTDGSVSQGTLGSDGRIYVGSLPPGTCDIRFFEMIDLGVPAKEVKRAWDWKSSAGDTPENSRDLHFKDNEGQTLILAPDADDPGAGQDNPE